MGFILSEGQGLDQAKLSHQMKVLHVSRATHVLRAIGKYNWLVTFDLFEPMKSKGQVKIGRIKTNQAFLAEHGYLARFCLKIVKM